MTFPKLAWLARVLGSSRRDAGRRDVKPAASAVEPLEGRMLLSAAPRIINTYADNRGGVVMTLDAKLDKTTVNTSTVMVRVAGSDGVLGNGDDVQRSVRVSYDRPSNRIYVDAALQANQPYMVVVRSSMVKTKLGVALDGEFTGGSRASGNGVPGGKYVAKVTPRSSSLARFTTLFGEIDVRLDSTHTPLTVANFLSYANSGAWDGTYFHRSMPGFVIQGGGFNVRNNAVANVATNPSPVVNEPGVSNLRGTIAMARLAGDANSATDQWFFNLSDTNASTLDVTDGGFTAFGNVTAGMSVVDQIAALPVVNASSINGAMTNLPTLTPVASVSQLNATNLVFVYRIAIKMKLSAA